MSEYILTGAVVLGAVALAAILLAVFFRVVVSTNEVHIVQSAKKTVSYGKDQTDGNTFYKWPAWVPVIGVRTIVLPVSVFDLYLGDYAAYDKGRVPFVIDIMAFFRVTNPNIAAQRVHSVAELMEQLKGILQGAARTILASSEIEEILEGRGKFGEMFTKEVDHQLEQWGVQTVKNIEFMDIRDSATSKVIANIMAKKQSFIEMESRVQVAKNSQAAQTAEIEAQREVKTREQEALQQIGMRTAEKDSQVGQSNERAKQSIKEQERMTAEKSMAVLQVQHVRQAEIQRDVQVVAAEQDKKTAVIKAEGHQQQTVLIATGDLEATKRRAEGVQVEGAAKAEAEKLMQLAPVQAQITLAKEIGSNDGYQKYLVGIRQIEANQVVGIEQAKALTAAEIKIIANSGGPVEGVKSVMDLLTPKGGTQLGAAFEAFKNTEAGAAVLGSLGVGPKVNGSGATR